MTKFQFKTITEWQNKTFTKATIISCLEHLSEEIEEVKNCLTNGIGIVDDLEVADCFLLLIGVANKAGMDYQDIVNAIDKKMEINYKRKWGEVNEKGYVKHIKDEPPTMGMSY